MKKLCQNIKKKSGYIITCIAEGSPAEKSGLELYDHIIGVDNDNFFYIWFADDREVVLTIERNGKIIKKKSNQLNLVLFQRKNLLVIKNTNQLSVGEIFYTKMIALKKFFNVS